MRFSRFLAAALAAFLLVGLTGFASAEDTPDQAAIRTVMHGMFDKPDAELVIAPVVVESGFAVAGWTQGNMGGRAFLKKDGAKWTLILCTGDGIRSVEALRASGVPGDAARRLAAAIMAADTSVDPERLKSLASFEGVVRMDGQAQCGRCGCLRLPIAILILALACASAFAHAVLIGSDPVDGAVLGEAPSRLVLTFSEPVSPLVLRLVAADGTATVLDGFHLDGNTVASTRCLRSRNGTHALSWRVVSADGHPVGGSVLFSVGAPSPGAAPNLAAVVDWPVVGLDLARAPGHLSRPLHRGWRPVLPGLSRALGMIMANPAPGAGSCASRAPLVGRPPGSRRPRRTLVGNRPSDRLADRLRDVLGTAALLAALAALSRFARDAPEADSGRSPAFGREPRRRSGSPSPAPGMPSAAAPQWLTRPAVFIHAVGVAIWIGALPPLD